MKINAETWVSGIQTLPIIDRYLERLDELGPETDRFPDIAKYYRVLGLPGPSSWQRGDFEPPGVELLMPDGSDLLKIMRIVFADDETPQFPDGERGAIGYRDEDATGHICVMMVPGLKITGNRSGGEGR